MATSQKIVRSDCRQCTRVTRHAVLCEHIEESSPEGYHEKDAWQIVQCQGCLTTGFRHRNDDYEQVWEDHEGEVHHTIVSVVYPRVVRNHRTLNGARWIPGLIQKIYRQTLSAYSDTAYVLASIGLRGTIEAVCNHLQISGNNLEKRIDQLFKGGYVSNADKKRLHAIRFLGNDAAHEVKEPKESELRVALEIVEHLLNSVFILEKKAKSLEIIIESYDEFLRLLASCVKAADATKAVSLGALLAAKRRLVGNNVDAFEDLLKNDIANGEIKYLTMAQLEKVGGKDVQLYAVGNTDEMGSSEDDEDFL